jgi:hypothetical protein
MKHFAAVSLLSGFGVPRAAEPGSLEWGLEVATVPHLSERQRTVGFGGTKTENLNRTSLFARPRLRVGLPRKLALTVSYLPPVELYDVTPHLAAVALERPLHEATRWRLGARLVGQYGTLEGDFTCSAEEAAGGSDPQRNPFGCEEASRDQTKMRSAGLELVVGRRRDRVSRLEPYLALAVHHLELDFRVDARYSGVVDRTVLRTAGSTLSLAGGLSYRLADRWALAMEIFYSPLEVVRPPAELAANDDLLHLRGHLSWSPGRGR